LRLAHLAGIHGILKAFLGYTLFSLLICIQKPFGFLVVVLFVARSFIFNVFFILTFLSFKKLEAINGIRHFV
jgi:hypothetical protein